MTSLLYVGFLVFILAALALDLALNRRAHIIHLLEALAWAAFWISCGLAFTVFVYNAYEHKWLGIGVLRGLTGSQAALQYLTAYFIEESLSIDNMLMFAMIFAYFKVPRMYQHRVLFWGIVGAIVMRGAMISAGSALLRHLVWISYILGALLLFSAIKLAISRKRGIQPGQNVLVRMAQKFLPQTSDYRDAHFLVTENGRRMITPLFLVLIAVETSDLFFALDSIPAVLSVTHDPFLVFTSNVFAILGLRSLYFALSGLFYKFRYLQASLVALLAYVGMKMLLENRFPIPIWISLIVVLATLVFGVAASLLPWRGTVVFVAANMGEVAQMSVRQARRIAILLIGSSIILGGVAMLVLPGPGLVTILLGLALLATEFVWARNILHRMKKEASAVMHKVRGTEDKDKKERED